MINVKTKKIILVGAGWAPFHNKLKKLCQEIADEKGLEFEEKIEDWMFLKRFGEKDELGGTDIPQIFVEYEGGEIVHVMTKVPLSAEGNPNYTEAKEIILSKIK